MYYLKMFYFQDLQNKGFLEVINKYVEVHATVGGGVSRNLTSPLLKMAHLPHPKHKELLSAPSSL